MTGDALRTLLDELADLVAAKVVERQRADVSAWVDQRKSVLGARRHIALVRRLLSEGDPRVAVRGRRYLARRDVIDAALTARDRSPDADVGDAELVAELGLEVTGRR
jgi:hypothetical protein